MQHDGASAAGAANGTNGTGDTNGSGGASGTALPEGLGAGSREVRLDVQAIRLAVHLGCMPAERAIPQEVEVGIAIRFSELPPACWTDALEDTVCYAELAALAREHCSGREFRLIERLALELYGLVRDRLPRGARLELSVNKVAPPVPEIERGVRFTIADR
ncbi:MAG: dihydroneopterin aldolase [Thermodesulfobacteriota bacterium]